MEQRRKKPTRRSAREKTYHHGDLAAALVEAAEAVLTERGVEGFTLRECARRAGVSHAAPAHHFGDARGLLTEVAALGFERLTASEREARDEEPAGKRLIGTGLGYVRFALSHPAQFQLMFQKGLVDHANERLATASRAAFDVFIETYMQANDVAFPEGMFKDTDPSVMREWALVHGFATLAVQGQMGPAASPSEIQNLMNFARAVFDGAQSHGSSQNPRLRR